MTALASRRSAKQVAGAYVPATRPTCLPLCNPPLGILSVSAAAEDHIAVRQSLSGIPCRVQTAESCYSAFQILSYGRISIVICERDLPDGSWLDALDRLDCSPERPLLIVTSRLADEWLWAEVLNLGGYDVLAKPFNAKEIRHVMETACLASRHWNRGQRAALAK
jgi:DNA-binding response OmpR family regulator